MPTFLDLGIFLKFDTTDVAGQRTYKPACTSIILKLKFLHYLFFTFFFLFLLLKMANI